MKEFFRKLTGWHLTTPLQINICRNSFQGLYVNKRLRMATSPSCIKWFIEKHLWNSFLLYLVVEILQLVH